MQANKENQDAIYRIDPESSEEISNRFEELVELLQEGTDEKVSAHLDSFHHSDLADAVGLITGSLRKRLLNLLKVQLDPDLLFELEDHLRHEISLHPPIGTVFGIGKSNLYILTFLNWNLTENFIPFPGFHILQHLDRFVRIHLRDYISNFLRRE